MALSVVTAGTASAECFDIAEGDKLVVDLTSNQIIRLTDVEPPVDPNANQELICVGKDGTEEPRILFPRSLDNDREGRLWVSMNDNVVRVDPALDVQVNVVPDNLGEPPFRNAPPRGIVKERDGPIYLGFPAFNNLGHILLIDPQTGFQADFSTPAAGPGFPLGLIFDPRMGTGDEKLLLASSQSFIPVVVPGVYAVNEIGGVNGIARDGFIAIPYRLAAVDDQFIYVSDIGGESDPDGAGPEPPVIRPPQVLQIDRTVPFDFNDPMANPKVNQKVVSEAEFLDVPIGIVLLDGNGANPDSLLVASGGSAVGTGLVLRIDFDPLAADPSATSTQTLISQGQFFSNPWGIRIVEGIDPLPKEPLYVTDVSLGNMAGVFEITPDERTSVVTGGDFVRPNGIVADPGSTDLLLVADGGAHAIIEVNITNETTSIISQDDLLQEPLNVIVDADDDLVVTQSVAPAIIRVDRGTGIQSIISPSPTEKNFFQSPVSTGIDPLGFLLVTDAGTGNADGRLISVSPVTGKQWCERQGNVFGVEGALSIDGVQDLIFRDLDPFDFYIDVPSVDPIVGFDDSPDIGFYPVSTSTDYVTPRGLAIAENLDILTVDAGNSIGDGRVLRLDPLTGAPIVVLNSTGLGDPFGVTLAGKPRLSAPALDSDGDGVLDLEDNCIETPNPDQQDTNGNCIGNACDTGCYLPNCSIACDNTGDGRVGAPDFSVLLSQIGNDCDEFPSLSCTADCAEPRDNKVGSVDFSLLIEQIGNEISPLPGVLVSEDPVGPCTDPGPPDPFTCTLP